MTRPEQHRRYNRSPKGRARKRRYALSGKKNAMQRRYRATARGKMLRLFERRRARAPVPRREYSGDVLDQEIDRRIREKNIAREAELMEVRNAGR